MKNILKYIVCIIVLVFQFTACQDKEMDDATGYVSITMEMDDSSSPVFSKAVAEVLPSFALDIYSSTGRKVMSYADMSEVEGQPIELVIGKYYAIAYSQIADACFDEPAYRGVGEFRIASNEMTPLEITCTLSNLKVTAEFDKSITESFSEYILTVTNGKGTLVFSSVDGTLDKEGYFSVTDNLSWSLRLVNNEGLVYEELKDSYTDLQPRQHYNLKFSLGEKDKFGGGAFEVTVDNSFSEQSYDLVLDFDAVNNPYIYSKVFEFTLPNIVYEGVKMDGRIFFGFDKGLRSIRILHEDPILESSGLARANEFVGLDTPAVEDFVNKGILVGYISEGDQQVTVDMSGFLARLPKGTFKMTLETTSVDEKVKTVEFIFTVKAGSPVEVVSVIPWAKYASVVCAWHSELQPQGLSVRYKSSTDMDWIEIDPVSVHVDASTGQYTAEITGLELDHGYEVMAVTSEFKESKIVKFKTENQAETLPNLSFDDWRTYNEVHNPNKGGAPLIWDTANEGSKMANAVLTSPERTDLVLKGNGKAAARLESKSLIMNIFSAGNIYTGDFLKATMPPKTGASLKWGVPFRSRPYALKGWYKYKPVPISHTDGGHANLKGKMDEMSIMIFITDWKQPFEISTSEGRFVDVNRDKGIIAFGMLTCGKSTDGYVEFTIPLEYRDLTRKPTYIVISAAASRYGDYFTGGAGSVLLLDEFSLIYDPSELEVK